MNVLLVSQCHQNALKQTRRVLDQFAERRGERTWQTAITRQGLQTLHALLRKTARKNTAVACHWVRAKNHTELLWVVGNRAAFNSQGAAPTGSTLGAPLRRFEENDWHSLRVIRLLAGLAALWHDQGKANDFFRNKLFVTKPLADPFRHEWVSLRLLQAFVGGDDDQAWLARLAGPPDYAAPKQAKALAKLAGEQSGPFPFQSLPPLARAVGWLFFSHHRLPVPAEKLPLAGLGSQPEYFSHKWNGSREGAPEAAQCWRFGQGLALASRSWQKRARRLARAALAAPELFSRDWLQDPHVLHLARLALVMADHHYSSLSDPAQRLRGDQGFPLTANTVGDPQTKKRKSNQPLDEHLIGVERGAGAIVQALPNLDRKLPRVAEHKGFRRRSRDRRFRWQDQAHDLAASLGPASRERGFFGVNLASTGCGKTLGNGRIMYALADPLQGARFTLALGLRVLTLQTGEAYRRRLRLEPADLAVLVGGGRARELYQHYREQEPQDSDSGSESAEEELMPPDAYLHYDGGLGPGPLAQWLAREPRLRQLVNTPILACTIDHLIPATEALRGGRHLAPMLRLMSADLVLDEPDDFGLNDLPALARLVNWAGLLGSRVLLSSATLPPSLVQGLFMAYLSGRGHFQKNRGRPGRQEGVVCAWFDEFSREAGNHADGESFLRQHGDFAAKRLANLEKKYEVRRRAEIVPLAEEGSPEERVAAALYESIWQLHTSHHVSEQTGGKRVSFGLARMANIRPLAAVARVLAAMPQPRGACLHLCCYHSQYPLLVRSALESRLDRLLLRNDEQAALKDPEIRRALAREDARDHVFLVLASPVAEVGRDHDYDWAVVEPSSLRSIIQLAGRVRRHRPPGCPAPNIHLLETNFRALETHGNGRAFQRPGFEGPGFELQSHNLRELLRDEQYRDISSAPRIVERERPDPTRNLADLEHAHLRAVMFGDQQNNTKPASAWWETPAHLSGAWQWATPFRYEPGQQRQTYAFLLDDDCEEAVFHRIDAPARRGSGEEPVATQVNNLLRRVDLPLAEGVRLWGETDYPRQVQTLAESLGLTPQETARRYGTVELDQKQEERGWGFHPALGIFRE